MTDPTVRELLPSSPFKIGGPLSIETGREVFVELSDHELLRNNIVDRSIKHMTIWSLVGPIGIGRTWTMAWLARRARNEGFGQEDQRWEAALVPGLGGDGSIRAIFEGIFRSTAHLRADVKARIQDTDEPEILQEEDAFERILRAGLSDESVWAVFTGNRGRFPAIRGVEQKPKWTDRETQIQFLVLWFQALRDLGIDHLLLLIDEFESVTTRLGKSKLIDLSDGLRRFFDVIENEGDDVPRTQVVLSLTAEGANRIDPSYGSAEVAGWIRPLQDRMEPPYVLSKLELDGAKMIVEKVMDVQRTEAVQDPYAPYTEDAIERAFEASDGLPRRFTKILNQAHQNGYRDTVLDGDLVEEAIKILGLGFEVPED